MSTWNLGSAATQLHSLIEDIPTAISGAILLDIVDRQRLHMEAYLGVTIGSTGIAERFQPALIHLSAADLLNYMNVLGADLNSVSLGEFSESKGGESNLAKVADYYRKLAEDELKAIGRTTHWQKVNG